MALKKIKLGDYISQYNEKNDKLELSIDNVRGISTQKMFIETKANMEGVPLNNYRIVRPNQFAYVPDTSRRGDKISLAFNNTKESFLVSSISVVFFVDEKVINPEYLFMYFNRPEFDRYSRYNSFGSAREPFNWEDMCDIEIELPDLTTQQKYVDVYLSMIENQKAYEKGLDDLKLVCDAYVEQLRKNEQLKPLSKYLTRRMGKNKDFSVKRLIGVGKDGFIEPKQSKDETNGHICYLVKKNDFVFAPPQLHQGSIDYYLGDEVVKCSDAYIVFYVNNEKELNPHYLMMMLKNPNMQNKIWFYRDGVREQFNFEQLIELEIPIPDIKIQKSIADIYLCYIERKEINEKLKNQIKNICPILIKGSIEEGK